MFLNQSEDSVSPQVTNSYWVSLSISEHTFITLRKWTHITTCCKHTLSYHSLYGSMKLSIATFSESETATKTFLRWTKGRNLTTNLLVFTTESWLGQVSLAFRMCPITATNMSRIGFLALRYFDLKNRVLRGHLDFSGDFNENEHETKITDYWWLVPNAN